MEYLILILVFTFMSIVLMTYSTTYLYRFASAYLAAPWRVRRDLREMKAILDPLRTELAPLRTAEDFELLSALPNTISQQGGFTPRKQGELLSIYYEPMAAYATIQYPRKASGSLTYVVTADHSFLLRERNGRVNIKANGTHIGQLQNETLSSKHMAPLEWNSAHSESHIAKLSAGSTVIADLIPTPDHQDLAPRLFQHVEDDIGDERLKQMTALIVYKLLQQD